MKVAIQGIEGSFHAEAARKLPLEKSIKIYPCATFTDVFSAVSKNHVDAGLVAIENSIHGSINAVYRLLERNNLWVSGETTLHIDQYLIACAPITLESLQQTSCHVLSQAPALAQVEQWLDTNLPNAVREETQDTAESVRYIVQKGQAFFVAVAGKHAAKQYNGIVIAGPINDDPHNYTRFVLLRKEPVFDTRANRTMILLKTDHSPGALLRALQIFANHSINLSKLDSHPIAGDARHYAFYIDYEVGVHSIQSQETIKELTNIGFQVKVLGSYHVIL